VGVQVVHATYGGLCITTQTKYIFLNAARGRKFSSYSTIANSASGSRTSSTGVGICLPDAEGTFVLA